MSESRQHDPLFKRVLRAGWRTALEAQVAASGITSGAAGAPRVFYGGARSGDIGGPKVKIQRLKEHFPEYAWTYNLVYLLSNAPYLSPNALARLKKRHVPMVLNQNGVFYPGWFDGNWKAKNAEMAEAYHAADHVFYQSAFCRAAADEFLGQRKGAGEILFNAVDTARYTPREDYNEPRTPYRYLVTGKIGNHLFYRLETAIRGLAGVRDRGLDAALDIAGWIEPDALARAKALTTTLGLSDHVSFGGSYTQQKAPDIYRRADAYLMTKHNDPCPNTVLEALACGLPVVYSRSGGVPELVGDCGVGLKCEESWEEAKSPLLEDVTEGMSIVADNHAALSVAARNRAVDVFDLGHWIARHGKVFDALLARDGVG